MKRLMMLLAVVLVFGFVGCENLDNTTFTVSYEAGEGSGIPPESISKKLGETFNLPGQGNMIAPSGKSFSGWRTNGHNYSADGSFTVTGNTIFLARWASTSGNSGSSGNNTNNNQTAVISHSIRATVEPVVKPVNIQGNMISVPAAENGLIDSYTDGKSNFYLIDMGIVRNSHVATLATAAHRTSGTRFTVETVVMETLEQSSHQTITDSVTITNTKSNTQTGNVSLSITSKIPFVKSATLKGSWKGSWTTTHSQAKTNTQTLQTSTTYIQQMIQTTSTTHIMDHTDPHGIYRDAIYAVKRIYFIVETTRNNNELISVEPIVVIQSFKKDLTFCEQGIFDNAPVETLDLEDGFYRYLPIPLLDPGILLLNFSAVNPPRTINIGSEITQAKLIGQYPAVTFNNTRIVIANRTTPLAIYLENFGMVAPSGIVGLTSENDADLSIYLFGRNRIVGGIGTNGGNASAPSQLSNGSRASAGSAGVSGAIGINVKGLLNIDSSAGSLTVFGGNGGRGGNGASYVGTENNWNGQNHGGHGGTGGAGGVGISARGLNIVGGGNLLIAGGNGDRGGNGGVGRGRRWGGSNVGSIPRAGDGGNGGTGGNGGIGVNAQNRFSVEVTDNLIINGGVAGNGGNGGTGGNGANGSSVATNNAGGHAGRGGHGGIGGVGVVLTQHTTPAVIDSRYLEINGGRGGNGGNGGNGGRVWAGIASGDLRPRAGNGGNPGNGGNGGIGLREARTANTSEHLFPRIRGGAGGSRGGVGSNGAYGNARPAATSPSVDNATNGTVGQNIVR